LVQVAGADLGIEKMLTEVEIPASATRQSALAFTCGLTPEIIPAALPKRGLQMPQSLQAKESQHGEMIT